MIMGARKYSDVSRAFVVVDSIMEPHLRKSDEEIAAASRSVTHRAETQTHIEASLSKRSRK